MGVAAATTWLDYKAVIETAYTEACACHGDLGLGLQEYGGRLVELAVRGPMGRSPQAVATEIMYRLHASDLYLGTACALPSAKAWDRFLIMYHRFAEDVAMQVCPNRCAAAELASNLVGDLFLPARSGICRIGTYDGRCSLATWLRVVISRRAINERRRKHNRAEPIELLPEIADNRDRLRIESVLLFRRYGAALVDSLQRACHCLNNGDRWLLAMRYKRGMQLGQIASLIGVHQSTVKRRLDRIQYELRRQVVSALYAKHRLTIPAVEECLSTAVSAAPLLSQVLDRNFSEPACLSG